MDPSQGGDGVLTFKDGDEVLCFAPFVLDLEDFLDPEASTG